MALFIHTGTGPVNAPSIDPDSTLIYGVAWDNLLPESVTITGSTWVVGDLTPGDTQMAVSIDIDGLTYDAVNTVQLSAAVLGESNTVTNRVTLSDGQIVDRSMIIGCIEQ